MTMGLYPKRKEGLGGGDVANRDSGRSKAGERTYLPNPQRAVRISAPAATHILSGRCAYPQRTLRTYFIILVPVFSITAFRSPFINP